MKHLASLQQSLGLKIVHREELKGGDDVEQQLAEWVQEATVYLVLLSPDFVADPVNRDRVDQALKRMPALLVVLIMFRHCYLTAELKVLHCLPTGEKPICARRFKGKAWTEIVNHISNSLQHPPAQKPTPPGPNRDEGLRQEALSDSASNRFRKKDQ